MPLLARGHVFVIVWLLGQIANVLADLDAVARNVFSENGSTASRGFRQSQQQLDGRGLASAVGAKKGKNRILMDLQVKRLERAHAFVGFTQAACLDDASVGLVYANLLSRVMSSAYQVFHCSASDE